MKIIPVSVNYNQLKRCYRSWKRKGLKDAALRLKGYRPICYAYTPKIGSGAGLLTALTWGASLGVEAGFLNIMTSHDVLPKVVTTGAIAGIALGSALFMKAQIYTETVIPNALTQRNYGKKHGNRILQSCQIAAWALSTALAIVPPTVTKIAYANTHHTQNRKTNSKPTRSVASLEAKGPTTTALKLNY